MLGKQSTGWIVRLGANGTGTTFLHITEIISAREEVGGSRLNCLYKLSIQS